METMELPSQGCNFLCSDLDKQTILQENIRAKNEQGEGLFIYLLDRAILPGDLQRLRLIFI
jgi:hypothetical protein